MTEALLIGWLYKAADVLYYGFTAHSTMFKSFGS